MPSVQLLNKIVLKWAWPLILAALAGTPSPLQAKSARPADSKAVQTGKAPAAAAPRAAPASATYTSADPGCASGRRRLWTEQGWVVRRVSSCR